MGVSAKEVLSRGTAGTSVQQRVGGGSCVRESSSQPHTPKGTATLLSCPEPPNLLGVPRSMHEAAPDGNARCPLQRSPAAGLRRRTDDLSVTGPTASALEA